MAESSDICADCGHRRGVHADNIPNACRGCRCLAFDEGVARTRPSPSPDQILADLRRGLESMFDRDRADGMMRVLEEARALKQEASASQINQAAAARVAELERRLARLETREIDRPQACSCAFPLLSSDEYVTIAHFPTSDTNFRAANRDAPAPSRIPTCHHCGRVVTRVFVLVDTR